MITLEDHPAQGVSILIGYYGMPMPRREFFVRLAKSDGTELYGFKSDLAGARACADRFIRKRKEMG